MNCIICFWCFPSLVTTITTSGKRNFYLRTSSLSKEGLTKNIRFRPPTKSWQIIVTEQRDRYATICMSEFSAKPSYRCWRHCFAFRYGVTEQPKKLVPQAAASVIELIVDGLYMPIY